MKKGIYIFLLFSLYQQLFAQHLQNTKADYQWLMGYGYMVNDVNSWNYDFNYNPMKSLLKYKLLNGERTTTNICDKGGDLAFQTNACTIADAQNQIIEGGDRINISPATDGICNSGQGGSPNQGTIILPSMTDDTSYFMFHLRTNYYFDKRIGSYGTDRLLLSKIVKTNGRYKVAFKDSTLLDYKTDSILISGHLTACRHANGRDWWIIAPKLFEKDYHVLLFTPNGIEKKIIKNIGTFRILAESGGGMSVFSPDGQKYVEYNGLSDAKIYDFDRCTGKLSNYKHIEIHDYADTYLTTGCAISPNSRFLYLASVEDFYQYDLWSDSIQNTKYTFKLDSTVVDTTQGLPLYTLFWTCQLGADGKIYIASLGGRKYMHVIEKPDLKGVACELQQNSITFPVYITRAIPFFPNYRLGALKSSPCDTLTTPTYDINFKGNLKIYPNPATDIIKVDMTLDNYGELGKYTLRIVDIVGKVHQTHPLSNYASIKEISVANMANGLYFVQLIDYQGFVIANSKIVVSK